MAIRGAEGMSSRDLAQLLDQGGRVVVFSYCVSALIITFKRSATVLVRPGQSVGSAGLPYTMLSLVAGWWGFPFGLIFTPWAIFENLSGGKDVTAQVRASLHGAPISVALPQGGRSVVVAWSDGQVFTATALQTRGEQVFVRFGNGREEWVPAERVRGG